jgi:hypothetical protein
MIAKSPAPKCPDTCPVCGFDLKDDGYPLTHQNDEGETCAFRWAPRGAYGYDED